MILGPKREKEMTLEPKRERGDPGTQEEKGVALGPKKKRKGALQLPRLQLWRRFQTTVLGREQVEPSRLAGGMSRVLERTESQRTRYLQSPTRVQLSADQHTQGRLEKRLQQLLFSSRARSALPPARARELVTPSRRVQTRVCLSGHTGPSTQRATQSQRSFKARHK